jgi:hypothetical protein
VGGFLLMPEDELVLVEHLLGAEELRLLATDDLRDGPRFVAELGQSQPLPQPAQPFVEPAEPHTFFFWAPQLGELRVLGDAPPPATATDRVLRLLQSEATDDAQSLLDTERSPIIRWSRARWHPNGALCPGLLQAQSRKTKDQPDELLRLYARVRRWMKGRSEKFNPFDHAPPEVRDPQPTNLKPFVVWAFPRAAEWVRGGGQIWPWNA